MKRGPRGSGINVDPARVRQARNEAGLSLAQVVGDQVSRTFLHLIETGRSRPSQAVLSLIARRTGRPLSYFLATTVVPKQPELPTDLATDLITIAGRIRQLASGDGLSRVDHEALKLLELTVRQGAELAKAVEEQLPQRSKRARFRTLPRERREAS